MVPKSKKLGPLSRELYFQLCYRALMIGFQDVGEEPACIVGRIVMVEGKCGSEQRAHKMGMKET